MLTVHLRINDAATGRPTPARLSVTAADGTAYPPLGRYAAFATGPGEDVGGHVMLGREAWYYTDGSCEIPLPSGAPLRVRATKGPEYRPLDETVTLGPGQMALRFAVERWSDVRSQGWYAGDARCHEIPPHAALLEAAAEDLDVVNLLAAARPFESADGTTYRSAPHLSAFSGQEAAVEAGGRVVAVNTLNTHPVLGRVALLHSHRPVFPLAFGGDDGADDWSVCDWCDQCHRKGGLTVWVNAFLPAAGVRGGEALVAAVLGKIDAIEFDGGPRAAAFWPWVYTLWDAGYRIPLAGGSGKACNRTPLGAVRTYARIPAAEAFTYKTWVEAVRAGRTYATAGPLLSLDVEGHGPGSTVDAGGRTVVIRAGAASATASDALEIVANGEVVAQTPAARGDSWSAGIEFAYTPAEPSWVAARCTDGAGACVAHTSGVWIRHPDRPHARRAAAASAVAALVEDVRSWVETRGRFDSPKRRAAASERCAQALGRLGQ